MKQSYIVVDNKVPFINWKQVYADLESKHEKGTEAFYTQLIMEWLPRLSDTVGTPNSILESESMINFTYFEWKVAQERFNIIRNVRSTIIDTFGDIVPKSYVGKNLIVEIEDLDFYYRYISHFYPATKKGARAQTFAQSSGLMCSDGYLQVVLNSYAKAQLSVIVAHELTHVLLAYYRPPSWLNEGIATIAETILSQGRSQFMREDENVDPWTWSRNSFRDFLSGKLIRNYKANYAYYKLAFGIVYQMMAEKTDLPRLLTTVQKTGDAEESLVEVTGKSIMDFVPPEIRRNIEESKKPSQKKARKKR